MKIYINASQFASTISKYIDVLETLPISVIKSLYNNLELSPYVGSIYDFDDWMSEDYDEAEIEAMKNNAEHWDDNDLYFAINRYTYTHLNTFSKLTDKTCPINLTKLAQAAIDAGLTLEEVKEW